MNDLQEQMWIDNARQGDQAAFEQLVRLYEKRVFALTLRMCRNPEDAAGPSLNDEALNVDIPDGAASPQEVAERSELRQQIEDGLSALSPEHRQVLILREMHQLTYDEIADTLSLDVGTVKSRISRGRKQLRNFLLKTGNFSAAPASKESGKEGCK